MATQKKETYFYGTGRRKTSSARIFLKSGTGLFRVKSPSNKKTKSDKNSKKTKTSATQKKAFVNLESYFTKPEQVQSVLSPLKILNLQKSFDVLATVRGGGFTGQAEALRHGLARALLKTDENHRALLKKNGFLTRDPRMVERKKYGRHKARKSTQFSKR